MGVYLIQKYFRGCSDYWVVKMDASGINWRKKYMVEVS